MERPIPQKLNVGPHPPCSTYKAGSDCIASLLPDVTTPPSLYPLMIVTDDDCLHRVKTFLTASKIMSIVTPNRVMSNTLSDISVCTN